MDSKRKSKETPNKNTIANPIRLVDDSEIPSYNIHDARESFSFWSWTVFSLIFMACLIGVAAHVSGFFAYIIDPEPTFSTTEILDGCRHEFFHEPKTYNESQRICASRNSQLLIFNNTLEHTRFNEFVKKKFHPFIQNQTTDRWKKRGLQIWTGIRIVFKEAKLTQLDWPDRMQSPVEMQKFYAISQESRICYATTMERLRQYQRAMKSRHSSKQFIVKDFTGKAENSIKEPGCWQIRILEENESLLLPFVCKSGTPKVRSFF